MDTRSKSRASKAQDEEASISTIGRTAAMGSAALSAQEESVEERVGPEENPMFEQFLEFQKYMAKKRGMKATREVESVASDLDDVFQPVDPGSLVAMSQVKPPTLEGLAASQIKAFRSAYRKYAARCVVTKWKQHPGKLVTPEQLSVVAFAHGLSDPSDLFALTDQQFFSKLCILHQASSAREWHSIISQVKMSTECSLEKFVEYADDFKFQLELAGDGFAPPAKEIVKQFVNGIVHKQLQAEMRYHYFETVEKAVEGGIKIVMRYRHVWSYMKEEKIHNNRNIKSIKADSNSTTTSTEKFRAPSVAQTQERSATSNVTARDPANLTCFKCLQKGHTAKTCPNDKHPRSNWPKKKVRSVKTVDNSDESVQEPVARSVRVFLTDISSDKDEFIRIPAMLSTVDEELNSSPSTVNTSLFLDTGANINSITREYLQNFVMNQLNKVHIITTKPLTLELAGGKFTQVSGYCRPCRRR
jgi:hypothetical protein